MQHKNSPNQPPNQGEPIKARLDQILNMAHPLFKLANSINWSVFEQEFGLEYGEGIGRPALSTRLVVGLHYLKYLYEVSDESVVERFIENPYWQYFCGFEFRARSTVSSNEPSEVAQESWSREDGETAQRDSGCSKARGNA